MSQRLARVMAAVVLPGTLSGMSAVEISFDEGTNFALALSPDGKNLVIDLQGTLWSLPAEGGEASALTDGLGDDRLPDWSPDGARIVFQSFRSGSWDIWVSGADGSQPEPLTEGPHDEREPVWSPDGGRVAFSSDRSGNYDLWVVSTETGDLTQLTRDPAPDYMPAWSPDGASIAFITERGEEEATELWTIHVGSGREEKIRVFEETAASPSWSPDGKRVSLVLLEGRMTSRLVALTLQDGVERALGEGDVFPFRAAWTGSGDLFYTADGRIQHLKAGEDEAEPIPFRVTVRLDRPDYVRRRARIPAPGTRHSVRGVVRPVVSPDGTKVAFTALGDVWIASADGSEAMPLTRDEYLDSDPSWSADGRNVVFSSDRQGSMDLWEKEVGSSPKSGLRRLTDGLGAETSPSCSPDGKWIAYLDDQKDLFLLPTNGEAPERLPSSDRGTVGLPSWSSDARHLALAQHRPASSRFREGANRIAVISVESGENRILEIPEKSFGSRDGDGPVWSPDGRKMAFAMDGGLWILPVSSSGEPDGAVERVADEAADFPSWFPDSRSLLYVASDQLKRVDVETREISVIPLPLQYEVMPAGGKLLIRGARLIDGTGAPARDDVDILVEGNRIASIEPSGSEPDQDIRIIEAAGKTVIPGLIEAHTHLELPAWGSRQGRIWLAYGVTSIRVPGASTYRALEEKESIASGRRIGPRIFVGGYGLDGDRVYYDGFLAVDGDEELHKELDRALRLDMDLLKTYVRLPDALQKTVIERAHQAGLPVSSHEIYPAVAYGVDAVEHMRGTSRRGFSPKVTALRKTYHDVIELVSRSGVYFTPTLLITNGLGGFHLMQSREPELTEDPRLQALLPAWARERYKLDSRDAARWEAQLEPVLGTIRTLADRGGKILAGTDSPLVPYGLGLVLEIELMSEAGLGPLRAIRSATQLAAEALGADKDLGTIEPGKLADLVILAADPSESIRNLRQTDTVIVDGRVVTVSRLLREGGQGPPSPQAAADPAKSAGLRGSDR